MTKIFLQAGLLLALFLHQALAFGQASVQQDDPDPHVFFYEPCQPKGIVTAPTAPSVNFEVPAKTNTFNWYQGPLANGQAWALHSNVLPDPGIMMPWWQTDNSQMIRINGHVDMPGEGWELIKRDLGYNDDGTPSVTAVINPYVILYNKHSGILRVFVAVADRVADYQFAEIELTFSNLANRTAGTLNRLQAVGVALENTEHGIDNKFSSVCRFLNQDGKWFMADFPMDYDPCVCQFDSKLIVSVSLISNLDVSLTGAITGTIATSNASIPNSTQTNSDFDQYQALFKKARGAYDKGQKVYQNTQSFIKDIDKWLDAQPAGIGSPANTQAKKQALNDLQQALQDDSFFRQGLNALPWIGFAVSTLDAFFGGGKEGGGSQPIALQPLSVDLAVSLTGTITTTAPYQEIVFNNPGTKPTKNLAEYPYYNEPLGVFSLIHTPVVERKKTLTSVQNGGYGDEVYQYRVPELLKYVLNPSSGLEIQDFKVALIQESSVYPNRVPAGWTYEDRRVDDLGDEHFSFRTPYRDAGCLQQRVFTLHTTPLRNQTPLGDEVDVNHEKVFLKLMLNLRKINAGPNSQNVLIVLKYPVEQRNTTEIGAVVPFPPVPGAICEPLPPQMSLGEVQEFCLSNVYKQATEMPREVPIHSNVENGLRANALGLIVYPNPAQDLVHVRFLASDADASVTLNDAMGRSVPITGLVVNGGNGFGEILLNVSDLPNGFYQCTVESAGRRQVKRLVVRH